MEKDIGCVINVLREERRWVTAAYNAVLYTKSYHALKFNQNVAFNSTSVIKCLKDKRKSLPELLYTVIHTLM